MSRVAILLLFASLQLFAGPVAAESWSKRLTQKETGDQMYSFTIKVVRLERTHKPAQINDPEEFLENVATTKAHSQICFQIRRFL